MKKAKISKKNIAVVVFCLAVGLSTLGYVFRLRDRISVLEIDLNSTKDQLQRQTENAISSSTRLWNCEYGGSDDDWFEKNAKTRTGQPEDLLKIADEIGLKHIRKVNLAYMEPNSNGFVGQYHQGVGAQHGGSDKDGRIIRIARGMDREDLKVFLAHEYLHYIWLNSATMQSDQTLEERLMSMYAHNWQLQERVANYAKRGRLSLTELFSYTCTEFSDKYMDKYVLSQCNKWIDRSKLRFAY